MEGKERDTADPPPEDGKLLVGTFAVLGALGLLFAHFGAPDSAPRSRERASAVQAQNQKDAAARKAWDAFVNGKTEKAQKPVKPNRPLGRTSDI